MSNPIAVILRLNGDPDDLLDRFKQARKSWTKAEGNGHSQPIVFATCRAEDGIVLVTGEGAEEDHKAFQEADDAYLHAAGVGRPAVHEQLGIARLGWEPAPADAS